MANWIGGIQAQGKLKHAGEALGFEGKTMHADGTITDGLYAELKEKLNLHENYYYYYWLVAELYHLSGDPKKEIQYLNEALKMAKKEGEKDILKAKLERANRK